MSRSNSENDEPADGLYLLERAVAALESRKNTIITIKAALREQMPDVIRELEEAETELPGLQEDVKKAIRPMGKGLHMINGHAIEVKSASTTTEVDDLGLIDRAIEVGEIDELLKLGVLKYKVEPHQIARLPTKQRIRYETYLKTKTGTASVVLPPELK